MDNNPLKFIFKLNSNGDITSQLESKSHFSLFFEFLEKNLNGDEPCPTFEDKANVILKFCNIIKKNRTIIEFFSSYNDKSIYFYLFDIYLNRNTSQGLKSAIISLLNELRNNIQTNKEIYSYLFNNLSLIYRGEKGEENFNDILILLKTILGDYENVIKPRNYFVCNGHGKIVIESDNIKKIEMGYCLTFILNFKINVIGANIDSNLCHLINIQLDNKSTININLKYPGYLMIKNKIVKMLPQNEYINLIVNIIINNNKLKFFFFANNENNLKEEKYDNINVKSTDEIKAIEFFDNFYGEFTSITLLSQKEEGLPGVLTDPFLLLFKLNKEGLWKRKIFENFMKNIDKLKSLNIQKIQQSINSKDLNNGKDNNIRKSVTFKMNDNRRSLKEDLVFIFTPFNYIDTCPNIIEDCLGQYHAFYYGNIRNHKYICYQNKLHSVCSLTNLFPIAEMFLIHPKLLTENNLELFLKIIENILNYRKNNIQSTKYCKFFKVLCLFLEKYPKSLYTEKILDSFANIGKTMFIIDSESLCKTYFKHILLNEKILSKYSSNLQIKFWNYIKLFLESDKSQIENFINMNRISLLLRFYDRKKYNQMCCQEHLDMFKDGYISDKTIMDPPMNKKLSYIKDVLDVIIYAQEPKNSFNLFKLLTLDLSPCLIKFIINIFKKALENYNKDDKSWKNNFIKELIDNNYEKIIVNTFIHSLPDVRYDIIEFMYIIHKEIHHENMKDYIEKNILLLKPFLLPTKIFYDNIPSEKKDKENNKNIIDVKEEILINEENKENKEKNEIKENINIKETINIQKDEKDNIINEEIISEKIEENLKVGEIIEKTEGANEDENEENLKIEESVEFKEENNDIKKGENLKIEDILENKEEKNEIKIIENIENNGKNEDKGNDIILNNNNIIIDNENKKEDINIINKEIKKFINQKNINEEEKGILVIKEDIYKKYIDKLFSSLIVWSLNIKIDISYEYIFLQKCNIKYIKILELVLEIITKTKDIEFLNKGIIAVDSLMELKENCFEFLYNKKLFSSLLDISFNCYLNKLKDLKENKIYEEFYNRCKNILVKIYIKTLEYTSIKDIEKFPSKELETIYIWGDKMLINKVKRIEQNILHSFMDEILFELLKNFKINYETFMEFNICDKNNDITKGYFFNNYIIFISELYHYCFQFRLDTMIYKNGLGVTDDENKNEVILPALFVYSMRLDPTKGQKIKDGWIDYKYIYEIYHRIQFIWQKDNIYKKYEKGKKKTNNKFKKYEEVLKNIILNKSVKNLYKKELEFLFYQLNDEKDIDIIVPTVKIIQIFIMCIISVYINKKDENELKVWLKEFKKLLFFIIISTTNLIMKDQSEFYKKIQENALYVITIGICFLRKCLLVTEICVNKIQNILVNTIILCLFIHKFEINYFNSHKKKRIFGTNKCNRNDLSNSAVSILFSKYIVDKNEQIIFTLEYMEKILTEKHYYDKIRYLLKTPNSDLEIGLFKNKKIISLLNEKYFRLYSYKSIVDSRFDEMKKIKENFNYDSSKYILELLPFYEKELAKYSNNSLEKKLDKKNLYRRIKKNLFSWNGYWSDKSLFFNDDKDKVENKQNKENKNKADVENKENENIIKIENVNDNNKIIDKDNNENNGEIKDKKNKIIKYKLLNHYTKSFMKPLFVPILDMNYYLPNFTGFNPNNLFNQKSRQIINLDIDQILKLEETSNQQGSNEVSKDDVEKNINNIIINNNLKNNEILEEEGEEKEKTGNYLREIYIKSNPEVADKLLKISNNLDFGKEEEEYIEEHSSSRKSFYANNYFLSCLVKTSHHIKGVCFVDQNQLTFKVFLNQQTGKSMNGINLAFTEKDEDYDPDRKTCFGSYFMFHHKDKNLYKISINYSNIKYIFRRRYYYKNSALEIFTNNNKSFYFNFKFEKDREIALGNIISNLKDYNKIIVDLIDTKNSFDNIIGYQHNNVVLDIRKSFFKKKEIFLSKKVEDWKKWKISNFEFLMWLNIFSNRSYNDISQYPVFPWTLIDYNDPLKKEVLQNNINNNKNLEQIEIFDYNYRDLSSPIGMLEIGKEGMKRKKAYLISYKELKDEHEEFEGQKPFFYGSNYSNPIYICNYLIRVFPFTNISIELQGNKMDDSNRIFSSIKNTFITCTSLKTDVRELIPEFFYLPEMLINLNDINLGKRDNDITVNDVETPCNNDPYKFIETMKNILENNKISYNLQNWIDLIFGYKARGKEAEQARNIFSEASYQENINLNEVEDKNMCLRMVEFGMIPNQIMTKECPKREKKEDVRKGKEITDKNAKFKISKIKKVKEENEENDLNEIKNNYTKNQYTIKSRLFYNEKIMTFDGNSIIERRVSSFSEEKAYYDSLKYNKNRMRYYYTNNERQNKGTIFCNQGKTVILGGFYDGSIIFLNFVKNTFKKIIPFKTEEPILALALDEEEKYLFVGNIIGNIIIYEVDFDTYECTALINNTDQLSEISHIDVSNELNLWLSASIDGFVNLYTMPSFKLVRSIKTLAKNLEYAFLSTSTLPSIIVINIDNKNRGIYSYSINGKLLHQVKGEDTLLNPIIIKDLNFNEYLVYISKNNNSIVIRNLPFLNYQNVIKNLEKISSICVSDDLKILYAINYEDDQIYIVKDDPKLVFSN